MQLQKTFGFSVLFLSIIKVCIAANPNATNAEVKTHMKEVTVPASNTVFSVANETPKNDEDWRKVKANALALVESGKWLLKTSFENEPIWKQATEQMMNGAKSVAKSTESKDTEKAIAAGDALYVACEACHAFYLNKSASAK